MTSGDPLSQPLPLAGERSKKGEALLQQLAQPPDHPHGPRDGMGGNARVERVVPDAAETELLRGLDLPFVVVAHHPGVAGGAAQTLEYMLVYGGLGLAPAELALDLDVVEAM